MPHRREVEINSVDCPRCGCFLKKQFVCNCGQIHSDVCDNCGRFTELGRTEHIEMSLFDNPCSAGPVMHEHQLISEEELRRRFQEAAQRMKASDDA